MTNGHIVNPEVKTAEPRVYDLVSDKHWANLKIASLSSTGVAELKSLGEPKTLTTGKENAESENELKKAFDWFLHQLEEQKQYQGKYVAIYEDKVLADGKTFKETYDRAKEKYPYLKPLVSYIQEEKTLGLEQI